MITYAAILAESKEQVQDASATTSTLLARAINQGAKKFGAVLAREWRTVEKTFSLVASQQYYQTPEDCIRLRHITVTIGGIAYPLTEVPDEDTWRLLNVKTYTSSIPQYFYVRGNDEFGIYPIPTSSVADAGRINYERRQRDMGQDDYSAGTITVTNASATVTGSSTVFTATMVGRSLRIDDPSGDGMWYKVASFTSTTVITLENTYAGITGSGFSYKIGELPDIPEEFHESLIDYACYRYYRRRRDTALAGDMKAAFYESLVECQTNYSSKTGSQYFRPLKNSDNFVRLSRYRNVTGA